MGLGVLRLGETISAYSHLLSDKAAMAATSEVHNGVYGTSEGVFTEAQLRDRLSAHGIQTSSVYPGTTNAMAGGAYFPSLRAGYRWEVRDTSSLIRWMAIVNVATDADLWIACWSYGPQNEPHFGWPDLRRSVHEQLLAPVITRGEDEDGISSTAGPGAGTEDEPILGPGDVVAVGKTVVTPYTPWVADAPPEAPQAIISVTGERLSFEGEDGQENVNYCFGPAVDIGPEERGNLYRWGQRANTPSGSFLCDLGGWIGIGGDVMAPADTPPMQGRRAISPPGTWQEYHSQYWVVTPAGNWTALTVAGVTALSSGGIAQTGTWPPAAGEIVPAQLTIGQAFDVGGVNWIVGADFRWARGTVTEGQGETSLPPPAEKEALSPLLLGALAVGAFLALRYSSSGGGADVA